MALVFASFQGPRFPSDPVQNQFLTTKEAYRGHPTSCGPRDPSFARVGNPTTRDGTPGVPRVRPQPMSQGPGVPGNSCGSPLQPGVEYNGRLTDF